jgi:hypothetical protein
MTRIYVAGPFTNSAPYRQRANVTRAIDAGAALMAKGYEPFVPHLAGQMEWLHPNKFSYERYMAWGRAFLECCDALLFLGSSPGADRELAVAKELKLTI